MAHGYFPEHLEAMNENFECTARASQLEQMRQVGDAQGKSFNKWNPYNEQQDHKGNNSTGFL